MRLLVLILSVALLALGQANRYETVSIKHGDPRATACGYHPSPGQLRLDNCSLAYLIEGVYGVRRDRVEGLPAWTSSVTYSFVAKSVGPANPREQWAMLAAVLEGRFRLSHHHETRQQRVYELSIQAGGIHFPGAVPGGCQPFNPNESPVATEEAAKERSERTCGLFRNERLPEGAIRITVKAVTMAKLASALQHYVDRPVVDHTGSNKLFDVDFSFSSTSSETPASQIPPGIGGPARASANLPGDSSLPNVFAALKKVGLNLTAGRGGVDVMVIDRVERPSEN